MKILIKTKMDQPKEEKNNNNQNIVPRNMRKKQILKVKVPKSKKQPTKKKSKRANTPPPDNDPDPDFNETEDAEDSVLDQSDDEFRPESADHPDPPEDLMDSEDTRTLENMYGGKHYGKTAEQWKKFNEVEKRAIKVAAQKDV